MLMNKILLPVELPHAERRVVQQAAFLARHFLSELLLLHVVPPLSYPAGALESGHEIRETDLHAEIIKRAQNDLDQSLRSELDGITVRRLLLKGDPAREIVQTAPDEKVDLIVISTHGHGVLYRFLLGSVAAKVLHDSDCPVWTGSHLTRPADIAALPIGSSAHPTNTASLQRPVCGDDDRGRIGIQPLG
jgi:nucleotide-binding universal stress UspA family protein